MLLLFQNPEPKGANDVDDDDYNIIDNNSNVIKRAVNMCFPSP